MDVIMPVKIEQVSNGFMVTSADGEIAVFNDIGSVWCHLFRYFGTPVSELDNIVSILIARLSVAPAIAATKEAAK